MGRLSAGHGHVGPTPNNPWLVEVHMTFEAFDAALPIEMAGMERWLPAAMTDGASGGGQTLQAALHRAALDEPETREASRGDERLDREALVLDLWVRASGGGRTNFAALADRPLPGPAVWQGWLILPDDGFLLSLEGDAVAAKNGDGRASFGEDEPQPGEYVDENGNGRWDPGEEQIITVTGRRDVDDDGAPWEPNPGDGPPDGNEPGGGGGGGDPSEPPTDLFEECLSAEELSELSPEKQQAYLVAVEAAEIAREIAAMPDRDSREYGLTIYRDANGVITHSPIAGGNATSVTGPMAAGLPSWGSALGMVHSHPAILFNDSFPNFRLHPTPGTSGDWSAFNGRQDLITQDLMSQGYSSAAASAQANGFVQFIYGASGGPGTGSYELKRYDDGDEARQDTSSENQIANAEKVNMNLGTCGD